LLFLTYNSGRGGPLGSFKKRLTYFLSVLTFIAFIIFLNRAYYFSPNQNYKQITLELKEECSDLHKMLSIHINNSELMIQNKQVKIRGIILQMDCDTTTKEKSTFQLSRELKKEYYELENMISACKDSLDLDIEEKQSKIEKLTQQVVCEVHKENDTYANIITNILSAFIAFVIAFTFKNRILG
jgi:hypothetical protein